MHLLVPGAYRLCINCPDTEWDSCLNAPSGAGCLPTLDKLAEAASQVVSMHLLVPGAYRLFTDRDFSVAVQGLNAPSGAGCLPTAVSANRVAAPFTRR